MLRNRFFRWAWTAGVGALLLALLTPPTYAFTLTGVVTDSTDSSTIANANVRLEGTHIGAATDLDGRYTLPNIPSGTWTVAVSHIGYGTRERTIDVSTARPQTLDVALSPETLKLDAVVYTATRTLQLLKDVPVQTELVSSREIEQTASTTAAEALSNEIGVDVREDFSGRGISIQGVDPDRVLILVNGNRVIGRINGSIDLDQISTLGVKQIEVVKGAVSTLYGSEAIGGVVNIITEAPRAPFRVSVDVNGGGYVPGRESGYSALGVRAKTWSPALDASWRRGRLALRGGVRYKNNGRMDIDPSTPETEGVEQTARLNGNLQADIQLADPVTLSLATETMREEKKWVEESGLQSLSVYFDDEEVNRRNDASAELRCTPAWADLYSVRLYTTQSRHRWEKYTRPSHNFINYSENNEDYTEASLQLTKKVHPEHRVTFGADGYRWDVNAVSELGLASSRISTRFHAWDSFLQDEWYVSHTFSLVPGVRFERHDLYGNHVSPKLSARWSLEDNLTLRASVGQGYRAPTAKELYYIFNHAAAGYMVIGNENLDPETSSSANLSLEHTYSDRSTSRISLFYNDLENLIEYHEVGRTQDYPVGIYQYDNVLAAWTGGLELEREMRLGRHWQLSGAYSYTESRNRESGKRLLRTPAHTARMAVTWTPGRWTCRLWGRYSSPALFTDKFTTGDLTSDRWTNPYTLWSLTIQRDMGAGMSLYLKGDNLLDYTNPEYGPYEGRILLAGWRWNYTRGD